MLQARLANFFVEKIAGWKALDPFVCQLVSALDFLFARITAVSSSAVRRSRGSDARAVFKRSSASCVLPWQARNSASRNAAAARKLGNRIASP